MQSGGVIAIATPFDKEIADFNTRLGRTVTVYGSAMMQRRAASKNALALSAPVAAAADRALYLSKAKVKDAKAAEVISGGGDLTDLLANDKLKLAEIEEKKLPENVRKMNKKDRKAYLTKQVEERKKLQKELNGLLKKRSQFIITKKAELKKAGKGDGFDEKVGGFIREQAAKKGFRYEK